MNRLRSTLGMLLLCGSAFAQAFLGISGVEGSSPLNGARGVLIQSVLQGTEAQAVGLLPGDVIVSVDDGSQLRLITSGNILRSVIQGSAGRSLVHEVHTPVGPWQVIATPGAMVMTAVRSGAPGKASQPAASPGVKMKGKQPRPGGTGAAPGTARLRSTHRQALLPPKVTHVRVHDPALVHNSQSRKQRGSLRSMRNGCE